MQINNNANTNNVPKVNYDDKKYDVFFSFMVPNIDLNYLDKEGKIKLESHVWEKTNFKSFSIQIADNRNEKDLDGKLYTLSYSIDRKFGYEFDINDRNFKVIFGAYEDLSSSKDTEKDVKKNKKK